jgi:hypothetical protein
VDGNVTLWIERQSEPVYHSQADNVLPLSYPKSCYQTGLC